jgi:hypothetical protein
MGFEVEELPTETALRLYVKLSPCGSTSRGALHFALHFASQIALHFALHIALVWVRAAAKRLKGWRFCPRYYGKLRVGSAASLVLVILALGA